MPVESASLAQQPLDPVAANEKTADSTSRAQVDATNLADSRATPPSSPPPIAVETASSLRSPSMRSGTAAEWASRLSIVLTVAALAALGYFGVRALGLRFMAPGSAESAANGLQIEVADGPQLNAQQSPARENAQKGVDEPVSRLVAAPGDVGRMLPFIDRTYGVEVAENEGLLVVNCGDCQDAPTVRIGKRTENKTPLAIALPEGRHEMVLSYDGRTRYRYLEIVRGQTRVVDVL